MRRCSHCGRTPAETSFYTDARVVSDGLRAKCRECCLTGGNPGPDPIHLLDRVAAGHGGCWIWTGATGRHGYGGVKVGGRNMVAHRAVYLLIRGEIPAGLVLDHLCNVKRCVNPDHLEPVTQAVNMQRSWDHRKAAANA